MKKVTRKLMSVLSAVALMVMCCPMLTLAAEEVEEYITQIAFSGATEFLEKYKGKTTEDEIIGHFGLGFYSAFMVAEEVHIDSLSYKYFST